MKANYDAIIIGGGPAGLTSAIYLLRAGIKTLLIEKSFYGGQIALSDWIENYPGFPSGISGGDLANFFADQANKLGLETIYTDILSITEEDNLKIVKSKDNSFASKTIIIASGAKPRQIGIEGEEKFLGRGISTCATCDAPFCKNKEVLAIGGGDTAVQESLFLTRFAKKVYLAHRRDKLRAVKTLQDKILKNDKVEILWNTVPISMNGKEKLESVSLKNLKTNQEFNLTVNNCFVWIGIEPNSSFVKDLVNLDEQGFIIANSKMETSKKGIFVAGDVRNTPLRQVSTAVGDAAIAAMSLVHYLESI